MGERIGTAGWSIARKDAETFQANGTVLERYARVFSAVEVNSSFYRAHRPATWAKWADSVPERFRFAVKIPKTITHQAKLVDVATPVATFAEEVGQLGEKLAILLVQLPPRLAFDAGVVRRFFTMLRNAVDAEIVCEPRNITWFQDDADVMLRDLRVARVAADPALCPAAGVPGGWPGISYWRLHGSPDMYRSSYGDEAIDKYAAQIAAATGAGHEPWCIFDNTAASEATGNALSLLSKLRSERR
jgi:uncharacterized protein YecE (DUF72 family)